MFQDPVDALNQGFFNYLNQEETIMEKVTVKKAQLLDRLSENYLAHQAIFDEAVEGYRTTVLKILQDHIKAVKAGKQSYISVALPAPENHCKDYDRVMTMVDMSVADEIVLSESDFKAYVMDDWGWKQQFLASNSMYSATAQSSIQ